MDLAHLVVFAHTGGAMLDHDGLMLLFATIPLILIATIVVAAALRNRGLLGPANRTVSVNATLAAVAAALSLGAAAIHFAVVEAHLEADLAFGVFFVAVAWFQVIWSQAYVLRPARAAAVVGALVNAGVVGVWLTSRIVGLPLGPTPWVAEPIGALDLFATGFEVALIGVLLPALTPRRWPSVSGERIAFERAFVLATFSVATVALLASFALLGTPGVGIGP